MKRTSVPWGGVLMCVLIGAGAATGCGMETDRDNATAASSLTLITPYEDESDMGPIREAFSSHDRAPWGFVHNGIDFFPTGNLVPFRAAAAGVVREVKLWRNDKTSNWQVNVSIECDSNYSLIYAFEPMTRDEVDGETQRANILVTKGQRLSQGDPVGRLVAAGEGAHVHFGLQRGRGTVSPERYFTPDARASVLRLVRQAWPGARMSYEDDGESPHLNERPDSR